MIITREATFEDLEGIDRLYLQLNGRDLGLSPRYKDIFAQMKSNDAYHLLVAVDEDSIVVGSILGIICKSLAAHYEAFLVIEDVIVDDSQRRAGIGRSLFEKIEQIAVENACAYSILVSSGFRTGAHRFYESVGYKENVMGFRKRFDTINTL
jgi:phosphoglycolate phosphatase